MNNTLLFGICGIGMGHSMRQFPIINHFLQKSYRIGVFCFGKSFEFYKAYFSDESNVLILEVSVPWICGCSTGVNLKRTASLPENDHNFIKKNYSAMGEMKDYLGVPDLVISDYEPVSAQYSYIHGTKLVTIDQQSKHFIIRDDIGIEGRSGLEEVARLNLFFPFAHDRLVASFFCIDSDQGYHFDKEVILFPSILRKEIQSLPQSNRIDALKEKSQKQKIIVYISSYSNFVQDRKDVKDVFSQFPDYEFCCYVPSFIFDNVVHEEIGNILVSPYGAETYLEDLSTCVGAISTSGHSFVSELMFLCKPAYLIPLETYEQHDSAHIIQKHDFGISCKEITFDDLAHFLGNLNFFTQNIIDDPHNILMKGDGGSLIIDFLEKKYFTI